MAPPINALIRIGEVDNKHDLFSALVGEIEPRTVTADILKIKGKQDRAKEPIVNKIAFELAKSGLDKNKIILGQIPDYAHKSITGLIAGQMANMYNKPTLLGRPDNKGNWFGSARSLNNSNVENLKDFCEESGLFNWVAGHQAAFGWSIPVENIEKFRAYAEEKLPKVEKIYYATFGHKIDEDLVAAIPKLNELNEHAGPGFEEVLIYTRIDFIPSSANLIGKKANVLTLTDHKTGLEFIKFRFNDEIPERAMTMKIVGKPNINEWQGVKKPQIIIEDYEFVELEL
jgi:single-stranded-DNA-specific exonuclease